MSMRTPVEWDDNSNQGPAVRARLMVAYGDDGLVPAYDGDLVLAGFVRAKSLRASEAEVARLTRELDAADGRLREGRQLLARMVKYCREDKATTTRATRLERLVEQVAGYLNRTHEPRDILRQGKGKVHG